MKSRIVSLGKKIANNTHTENDFVEWCALHGIPENKISLTKDILCNITAKDFTRFKTHLRLFGDKVTVETFIGAPRTPYHMKLYQHYGVEPTLKTRSSVYDPHYISKRENISLDEAIKYVETYKKNKATNIDNFVRKYGQEEGTKKYNEWFASGLKKGHDFEGPRSKLMVSFWVKKGFTEEEARQHATDHQHSISPLHIEYYIIRGKTLTEAKKEIRKLHDKKLGRCVVTEYILRNNPGIDEEGLSNIRKSMKGNTISKLGAEAYHKKLEKTRKTFEEKGLWIPLEDLTDYESYRRLVGIHTNANDLTLLKNYDKRAKAGVENGYHLDHKFSISRGYIESVPPEVIGSLANLVFLPWRENVVKQGNCSIKKEELYESYQNKENNKKHSS